MRAALAALLLAAAFAVPKEALAAVSCSFDSNPFTLSFGSYDPVSGNPATATVPISFTCTGLPAGGQTITVKARKGNNGTLTNRKMIQGSTPNDLLPYTASLNASETPIWGTGFSGTQIYSTTLTSADDGNSISFTVYGEIFAAITGGNGDVHAGSYSDSVVLVLTY